MYFPVIKLFRAWQRTFIPYMQCLREDLCSLTSTVASKPTGVMTDSDYPVLPEPACLYSWEEKAPAITAGHLQPTAWMSSRTPEVTSTETPRLISSWINLGFNYSICWEVQFVSRSNNSCIVTLIKMYSLDLFSTAQPVNLLKKLLFSMQVFVGGGRQEKLTLSVCSSLSKLRFFSWDLRNYLFSIL